MSNQEILISGYLSIILSSLIYLSGIYCFIKYPAFKQLCLKIHKLSVLIPLIIAILGTLIVVYTNSIFIFMLAICVYGLGILTAIIRL